MSCAIVSESTPVLVAAAVDVVDVADVVEAVVELAKELMKIRS